MFMHRLRYIYELFRYRGQSVSIVQIWGYQFRCPARIHEQPKSPRSLYTPEGTTYTLPPLSTMRSRSAARLNMHRFQSRKQVPTGECAVEVLPTIGVKRLSRGIVVYDGDILHAQKRGETSERFFPELGIGFVGLRSNCQRFQRPLL